MPAPLLVGLSGPSSSGKTTLARLLRDILPGRAIILHQDDFYRPEEQLPLRAGLRDWDCAAALDLPAMESCLSHVAATGTVPDWLDSKEDRNAVGPSGVAPAEAERLRAEVHAWAAAERLPLGASAAAPAGSGSAGQPADVVIVDGFLLYGRSVPQLAPLFGARLMLRATYEAAKARREARIGYVTLEGFWEDPPGYVDKVVWPGYVEEHAHLFRGGNVDGDVDEDRVRELGIDVCPGTGAWDMGQMLGWALGEMKTAMREHWSAER